LICVVADMSRTPLAVRDCKGEVERESRRVRARGLSRGNRYSRGPCEQVQTVDSSRLSGYDGYKSID